MVARGAGGYRLIVGFALLWAVGKGCMNQTVFAYPVDGAGMAPTLAVYLLVCALAAGALIPGWGKGLLFSRTGLVCASGCVSVGFLLLTSFAEVPWGYVGAFAAAVGLALLNVAYLRKFMRGEAGATVLPLAVSVMVGDVFACLFSVAFPVQVTEFMLYAFPFAAAALLDSASASPAGEKPNGVRVHAEAVATPVLGFAVFTMVSVAVSVLFMARGPLAPEGQTMVHLAAPLAGAALYVLLAALKRHWFAFVVPVFLITAFVFLPVPFLGAWYLGPMKVFMLVAGEVLYLSMMSACLEATQEYGVPDQLFAAVAISLLNLATLLGSLVGMVCAAPEASSMTPYLVIEAVSFGLLLVTSLIMVAAERARRSDAPLTVGDGGPLSPDEASHVAARLYGLTAREEEILGYLLMQKTPQQIADELFLSLDTVRGHMKNIYRKADVHSRQELVLKARDV